MVTKLKKLFCVHTIGFIGMPHLVYVVICNRDVVLELLVPKYPRTINNASQSDIEFSIFDINDGILMPLANTGLLNKNTLIVAAMNIINRSHHR